ncbi:MAG: glutathione S-transferase N-terminal domain-containing protein [Erythrobacter sp.]|nr:glutathione S-transferase N-terminal domain-containing protein [Erythrobacter sp.]
MTDPHRSEPITLYGVPHSLYTGRARSYLIKAGIPFRELPPSVPHYQNDVIPKAGGKLGLPTIEFADGRVIRDGASIIDHFEEETGHTFSPKGAKQRFFSRLFDAIGAEGLLRPAMHYRWNFEAENLDYLVFHFEMLMPPGKQGKVLARKAADKMRGATRAFGVGEDTIPMVEALYADVLAAMDAHFAAVPYLLGGKPSIGDFGLFAPMFGHLGRDPKPLMMMQAKALRTFRWVERMGRETSDILEFQDRTEDYLADDSVPDTLIDLLGALSVDFVPETLAAAEVINAWIAQNNPEAGSPCERMLGFGQFDVGETKVSGIAQPYRFYMLARAQAEREAMDKATRAELDAMLERAGMSALIDAKLTRARGFQDNLEVWL